MLPADIRAAALDRAGIAVALLDSRGRIASANEALITLLGYRREQLIGRSEGDVSSHGEPAIVSSPLFRELLSGQRERFTLDKCYRQQNGTAVFTRVTVTLLEVSDEPLAIATVEDVTEKLRLEAAAEEVRRADERYALVARATNDVLWDWDAEHATIVWNDALQTMFGYATDQIDNRLHWWETHLHPDDRERVIAGINYVIEQGNTSWSDEYRFERADGTYVEVLDRGYIARAEDGTLVRMIGAMLDVTERKRGERIAAFMAEASAILASSLDYETNLVRVAQLAVPLLADWCSVDLRAAGEEYRQLAVMHAGEELVSHALTEPQSRPGTSQLVAGVIRTDSPRLIENVLASTDPAFEPYRERGIRSLLIVPIITPGAARLGGLTLAMSESRRLLTTRDVPVLQDAARRAAAAIEHARLYGDLQKALLAKDEFLAVLSHELSTPLTIMLGWASILDGSETTRDELTRGLRAIRSSAKAQGHLIEDVLDLSRVTMGKLRLDVRPVSVSDVVSESIAAVQIAAVAKRIDLVAPDTTEVHTVVGDPGRLRQVIWNLLTNAIKFTPAGGRVVVGMESAASAVTITVTDSGEGIDREFVPHVFEPFRQADASTSRSHGGLGLGLAIVRHLVEAHGGTVSAFSEGSGSGARFTITLPLAPRNAPLAEEAGAARTTEIHTPPAPAVADLRNVRVLFVDDQPDARDLARAIFSQAGAEIAIARSAAEALELCERAAVDVIVSDIGMPQMDGCALIAEVRRRDALTGRRTPAIAATAYGGAADRQRAISAGFDEYVRKPMEPAALTALVADVIRRVGSTI